MLLLYATLAEMPPRAFAIASAMLRFDITMA